MAPEQVMDHPSSWVVPSIGLRGILGRLADTAVVGCGGLAAIGAMGSVSRLCDQVNNGAPFWTAAGLASAAASLAFGRNRHSTTCMLAAAIALVGGLAVMPDAFAKPPVAATTSLRLVSFNAYKENSEPERAAQWLIGTGADVLVVSETTARLRAVLDTAYPYHVSCLPERRCSTEIFARKPFLDQGGLAKGGDPERRTALSAAWATVDTSKGPITILGLHLDHPWPMGGSHDEMKPIATFLEHRAPGPLVVAGDTNRVPWTFALHELDRTIGIPRVTHHMGTWPTRLPLMPIDHVYASRDLGIHSITTGPDLGSDHLPVVTEVGPVAH